MAHSPVSDSTSYSRRKREILKNQNAKKYTYDDDFDSDDASKRRSRTLSRTRSRTRSRSKSYSPINTKKQTQNEPQRRRSYSLTPSRSPSRSNSRDRTKNRNTNDNYKTRKVSKNSFSPSNLTPESSIKLKNGSKDTLKTKNSSYDMKTKSIPNGKVSQRSSESCPAPNQRTFQQKIKKLQKNLNANQTQAPVNQSAARVISAQRVKNNDLQNKIGEITIEVNKLREENKLLKKLQQREEKELKKLETQDVDVTRVIKNFTDEINSLKNNLRQSKNENSRLNNMLNDRDDELRVLKKRYNELKDILNDKKLLDSAELSKKLDKCERELTDNKEKNQTLERKLQILEKNHKHEIGVELAHHKETKKKLEKINEEMLELRAKLEEKERAIDVMNIYSRPNRDQHTTEPPKWKLSTQSLNSTQVQDSTPREKRKEYDRKLKETLAQGKFKPAMPLEAQKPPVPHQSHIEPKEVPVASKKEIEEEPIRLNRKSNDDDELQKKLDRLAEQEAELRRKDEAERQRREKKEEERLELIRQQEKRRKEEEERRLKEQKALEELERQKRWTSTTTNNFDHEDKNSKQKKDDLLAKLFSTELNEEKEFKIEPKAQPLVKQPFNLFAMPESKPVISDSTKNTTNQQNDTKSTSSNANWLGSPSKRTNNDSYKFPRSIENLHEGKPSVAPREENDSTQSNYKTNNDKDDLLAKLFGNSTNKTQTSKPQNNNGFLQSKLDDLDDLDFKPSKQSTQTKLNNETSKASFLPWDIPDAQTSSNKGTSSTSSITIRRPKENNSLFLTSNKLHSSNSGFIEDIEELAL